MRDIALIAITIGSIPFIVRRPYIGVLIYVWFSVMNPHRLTWNIAYDFNHAAIIGVVTLVSALFSKELKRPPVNGLTVVLLLFVAWTGVSTIFAIYLEESYVFWKLLMKTQLMVLLILMLTRTQEQLRQLIWVIVLSIAYYGVKGGAWILLTGGGERVWGPPGGYIQDNNALAAAIVMIIPLMRALQLTTPHRIVRWGLTGMMALCAVSVIGSYSRGALVAVVAMLFFMWWKGRQKLLLLLIALLAIPPLLAYMPDKWFNRMDTIAEYEQDQSASMRLEAWTTMFNIAQDRPLVGGGFAIASPEIWARYATDPRFRPSVAHSIYFQALGEHGFVGLGLYLLLLLLFWRHAAAVVRITRGKPQLAWAHDLAAMLQVTLVGYMVGGAFLSLVNFDVPYYLMAAIVVLRVLVEREARAPAPAAVPAASAQRLRGAG